MFQSSVRPAARASTCPAASRSSARSGTVPKLVSATTRGAAMANGTSAGSITWRATPGCNSSLRSVIV